MDRSVTMATTDHSFLHLSISKIYFNGLIIQLEKDSEKPSISFYWFYIKLFSGKLFET